MKQLTISLPKGPIPASVLLLFLSVTGTSMLNASCVQSSEEALATDLELAGITMEEYEYQEAVGEVSGTIARALPEIHVGAVIDDPARIYIKGPAPALVYEIIAESGYEMQVVDEQPYNFRELVGLSEELMEHFSRGNYPGVAIGFLFEGPRFEVTVQVHDINDPTPNALLAELEDELAVLIVLRLTTEPFGSFDRGGGDS